MRNEWKKKGRMRRKTLREELKWERKRRKAQRCQGSRHKMSRQNLRGDVKAKKKKHSRNISVRNKKWWSVAPLRDMYDLEWGWMKWLFRQVTRWRKNRPAKWEKASRMIENWATYGKGTESDYKCKYKKERDRNRDRKRDLETVGASEREYGIGSMERMCEKDSMQEYTELRIIDPERRVGTKEMN